MINKIYCLNSIDCQKYLHDKLDDWAHFTKLIINSNIMNSGKFYCLAPTDIEANDLYKFDSAKGMNIAEPYAEDVVMEFIYQYLNSQFSKSHKLISESFNFSQTGSF